MYQKKIEAYFKEHAEEFIQDIMTLCRIPSVGAGPSPGAPYGEENVKAIAAAEKMAQGFGFSTTNYDNYLLAVDMNEMNKGLDILAHLDVVPAPPEDWTVTQPFVPVIKDGNIYGRGTADNKGPAVASLYAMRAVKDLGIPLAANVRLVLGTDEERGGSDLDYYYAREEEAPMSFTPDADFPVINVEKGRLATTIRADFPKEETLPRIVSFASGHTVNVIPDEAHAVVEGLDEEAIGSLTQDVEQQTKVAFTYEKDENVYRLFAKGSAGHAAEPYHGNNALTAMLQLLTSLPLAESQSASRLKGLAELFPHGDWLGKAAGVSSHDDIAGDTTISLNIITMDETSFAAQFDGRCSLNANKENLNQAFVKSTQAQGLEFIDKEIAPPHHVSCDTPFVQTLLKCYEQYTGEKGECMSTGGGTYVHDLENGVAFGASMPGTNNNMHGADEFAIIEDLLTAAKIYTQTIIDLCGR